MSNFPGMLSIVEDPFREALFDDCTPLFDVDYSTGLTELLEECG